MVPIRTVHHVIAARMALRIKVKSLWIVVDHVLHVFLAAIAMWMPITMLPMQI